MPVIRSHRKPRVRWGFVASGGGAIRKLLLRHLKADEDRDREIATSIGDRLLNSFNAER